LNPELRGVLPYPSDIDYSYVTTSKGCLWKCSFCNSPKVGGELTLRSPEVVRSDLLNRMFWFKQSRFYFTDTVLPVTKERLTGLIEAFKDTEIERSASFLCESRVDTITEENCDLMLELGVDTVKLGIECVSDKGLQSMNKRQRVEDIDRAVDLCKKKGLKITAYLILGGELTEEDYKATVKYCMEKKFDTYVVNMWSFDNYQNRDYRFDAHFSTACAEYWDIPKEISDMYFDLQEHKGNQELKLLV